MWAFNTVNEIRKISLLLLAGLCTMTQKSLMTQTSLFIYLFIFYKLSAKYVTKVKTEKGNVKQDISLKNNNHLNKEIKTTLHMSPMLSTMCASVWLHHYESFCFTSSHSRWQWNKALSCVARLIATIWGQFNEMLIYIKTYVAEQSVSRLRSFLYTHTQSAIRQIKIM